MTLSSRFLHPLVLILTALPPTALAEDETIVFSTVVTADFGEDLGQSFGTLFEARDAKGNVVAGAGFADVYNTRFRSDRHTLQFFVRPSGERPAVRQERLPHPDLGTGVYLFDVDQKLFAWSVARGEAVRQWDPEKGAWTDEPPADVTGLRSGNGVTRIGRGTLVFANNGARFDGHPILDPPERGVFYNEYYAHGHLCFYHSDRSEADGFTRVVACAWRAPQGDASPEKIDLSRGIALTTKYVGETPFAWGQWQNEVMTVSNLGGVYSFDGSKWRTLREPDKAVSFQVYSMIRHRDRLLLAQYPTGELFEYRGQGLVRLEGSPPRLPEVSPSARESQTTAIYGGDLFVGVWPWAELWRYDEAARRWHSLGRMFTHPEAHNKTVHPYEAEAAKLGLVLNQWGQRVTGLVPLGTSLMVSTSSKGAIEWKPEYDFLTEDQRREYGAVIRLDIPGNLAASVDWKEGPTRFEFTLTKKRMTIRQDGRELASADLKGFDVSAAARAQLVQGQGVFGPFSGRIATPEWTYAPELMQPFWKGNTVHGESILFVRDPATGAARGSLLFPVQRVLAAKNSAGDVTYEEGRDYVWKADSREIEIPAGSRIPTFAPADLRRPAKTQKYELTHRDGDGEIYFGSTLEYHGMQTVFTYAHDESDWNGPTPKQALKELPRSIAKLKERNALTIVLVGDSISGGCNASGWAKGPPYQPPFYELLQQHLAETTGSKVELKNLSIGGTSATVGPMLVDKIAEAKPDLVILAFGMNDAAGRPAKEYQANFRTTIARIREQRPECEFVLIASMPGNRDWVRLQPELFPQYRDALAELTGPGVALADMTSIWTEFFKTKQDRDLTGNGVNHPNDFGHRVYAQVLSTLLLGDESKH